MTTTRSSSLGWKFSYSYIADGWLNYINNGEYTSAQESALVDALIDAQVEAFDALLPDDHHWLIHTSELQYPADDDTETGDLETLLEQSSEAVCARLAEIEAKALADLG